MTINQLLIHNDAILENISIVKHYAPNSKLLPMVKANAFGHGLINVARLISPHVDALAVARFEEAAELISADLPLPVVLMSGEVNPDRVQTLMSAGCHIVVSTRRQLELLVKPNFTGKITVWVKFNTGMNRLGLPTQDADDIINQLKHCSCVKELIIMTHLSDADTSNSSKTKKQIDTLIALGNYHSLPVSISNSAAIIQYPKSNREWVRPGIMIYGSSPVQSQSARELNLKPTMTLSSYLLDVRQQCKGDEIGYGSSWVCRDDILLGIIPLGYGDGYPRNVGLNTPVWINGALCPIVGRVSMDLLTVDLSSCHNPTVGDYVELWGMNLPVDEVAAYANTISNELFSHISPRSLSIKYLDKANDTELFG